MAFVDRVTFTNTVNSVNYYHVNVFEPRQETRAEKLQFPQVQSNAKTSPRLIKL